jgi:hypothetical protein
MKARELMERLLWEDLDKEVRIGIAVKVDGETHEETVQIEAIHAEVDGIVVLAVEAELEVKMEVNLLTPAGTAALARN